MKSLKQLNSYGKQNLTYTNYVNPEFIFNTTTPADQTATVGFNRSHILPNALEITGFLNPSDLKGRYVVDLSNTPSGTIVTWSTIPSGMTVQVTNRVYSIGPIMTVSDWNAVKNPTVSSPDFGGTYSYPVRFSGVSRQTFPTWSVTAGNETFLTTPTDLVYISGATTAIDNNPLIVDSLFTTETITLIITPNFKDNIVSYTLGGTGGTASYDSVTKVITITGTAAQVRSRAENISITTTDHKEFYFYMTYFYDTGTITETKSQYCYTEDYSVLGEITEGSFIQNVESTIGGPLITANETTAESTGFTFKIYPSILGSVEYIDCNDTLSYEVSPVDLYNFGDIHKDYNWVRMLDDTLAIITSIGSYYRLYLFSRNEDNSWTLSRSILIASSSNYEEIKLFEIGDGGKTILLKTSTVTKHINFPVLYGPSYSTGYLTTSDILDFAISKTTYRSILLNLSTNKVQLTGPSLLSETAPGFTLARDTKMYKAFINDAGSQAAVYPLSWTDFDPVFCQFFTISSDTITQNTSKHLTSSIVDSLLSTAGFSNPSLHGTYIMPNSSTVYAFLNSNKVAKFVYTSSWALTVYDLDFDFSGTGNIGQHRILHVDETNGRMVLGYTDPALTSDFEDGVIPDFVIYKSNARVLNLVDDTWTWVSDYPTSFAYTFANAENSIASISVSPSGSVATISPYTDKANYYKFFNVTKTWNNSTETLSLTGDLDDINYLVSTTYLNSLSPNDIQIIYEYDSNNDAVIPTTYTNKLTRKQ